MKLKPILLLAFVPLFACGDDDPETDAMTDVAIQARGVVGSEAFACGQTYADVGTSSSSWEGRDFRLYVSNPRLVDSEGLEVPIILEQDAKWQNESVVLLDFEDGSGACQMGNADLNTQIRGEVVAGEYSMLRFELGVPFEMNHGDAAVAPAPLNITTMFWNWQVGYKFLRVDGVTTGLPSWRLHLGSTACDGDMQGNVTACGNPNRATVEIANFDHATDTLVADLGALLAGADLETDAAEDPGCMSKPADSECAPYFSALGLPFGEQSATAQTFFRGE